MTRMRGLLAGTAVAASAVLLAACGGGGGSAGGGQNMVAAKQDLSGKKGGSLTVLASGDVDYIDAGAAYYQFSYMVHYATQRPLYSWAPDAGQDPTPDLATSAPEVSNGGKTITVKIRPDVKYSPPVNRAVTSADVKYAIERAFKPNVANGYSGAYLGSIEGVDAFTGGKANDISGIQTPDPTTIVFKLTEPKTTAVVGALALPISAPVPKEYASKFDAANPSTYGQHQVSTGPYMVKNDAQGNAVGYKATQSIELVRNPNWNPSSDYRKAYLDSITVKEGNQDAAVASKAILSGQSQINGDFGPPPAQLQSLFSKKSPQLVGAPSGGLRYIALNTTVKPLDNINVRKAIIAAADREAMLKARGGKAVGTVATHFIPPGIPGFDQAGGEKGTGEDFLANPNGDAAVAAKYLKAAGYPSGKVTGAPTLQIVGTSGGSAQKIAEITKATLDKLGFSTKLVLVTQDAMYTQFCNVPKKAVAVCPNVGWMKDFNDAQTILGPTFNGQNIVQQNNSNWPQLNVPSINKAMDDAMLIPEPGKAADAWGKIDTQVTQQAPAIPWIWDNSENIASTNVKGVINKFNAQWDLTFTSLK